MREENNKGFFFQGSHLFPSFVLFIILVQGMYESCLLKNMSLISCMYEACLVTLHMRHVCSKEIILLGMAVSI